MQRRTAACYCVNAVPHCFSLPQMERRERLRKHLAMKCAALLVPNATLCILLSPCCAALLFTPADGASGAAVQALFCVALLFS
jgi:hypothetical protein